MTKKQQKLAAKFLKRHANMNISSNHRLSVYRKGNRKNFLPEYKLQIESLCGTNSERVVFCDFEKTDELSGYFSATLPYKETKMVTLSANEEKLVVSRLRKIYHPYYVFINSKWQSCGVFILPSLHLIREDFKFSDEIITYIALISVDLSHHLSIDFYEERGKCCLDISEVNLNNSLKSEDLILYDIKAEVRTFKKIDLFSDITLQLRSSFKDLKIKDINNLIPNDFAGKDYFLRFYSYNNGGRFEYNNLRVFAYFYKKNFPTNSYLFPVSDFLYISARSGDPASYRHSINKIWEINKSISKEMHVYCQSHFPFAGDRKGNYYWIDMNSGYVKYLIAKSKADPDNAVTVASTFYDFCVNLHSQY